MRSALNPGGSSLFALAVLALISAAVCGAMYWADKPMGAACGHRGNCASCHQGSAPRTHTAQFVLSTHGHVAHFDRQRCYGCHVESSCTDCHLNEPPQWHTEAFRHPARGWNEREEHSRLASSRGIDCLECHQHRFQDQCSACHRADEWQALQQFFHETVSTKTDP